MGMKIGELAQRTGCQTVTIRYYEQRGLLPPPARSEGNYRLYGEEHVERLSFVRHCRSLDMTLEEIAALLKLREYPEQNCGEVNALLDDHIDHVAHRIAELTALEQQLTNLRRLCTDAQEAKHCGILKQLVVETTPAIGKVLNKRATHIHGSHAGRK